MVTNWEEESEYYSDYVPAVSSSTVKAPDHDESIQLSEQQEQPEYEVMIGHEYDSLDCCERLVDSNTRTQDVLSSPIYEEMAPLAPPHNEIIENDEQSDTDKETYYI